MRGKLSYTHPNYFNPSCGPAQLFRISTSLICNKFVTSTLRNWVKEAQTRDWLRWIMVPQGIKEKKLANGLTCPSLTDNTLNSFTPRMCGTMVRLESAFALTPNLKPWDPALFRKVWDKSRYIWVMKVFLIIAIKTQCSEVASVAQRSARRVKVDSTVVLLYNYTARNVRQRSTMCGGPAKSLLNTQLWGITVTASECGLSEPPGDCDGLSVRLLNSSSAVWLLCLP